MQIMTFRVYSSSPLSLHAAASELHRQTTVESFCAVQIQVIPKYDVF